MKWYLSSPSNNRDYGELVYRRKMHCPPAILYLRFDPVSSIEPAQIVQQFIARAEPELNGFFFVLNRDSSRKRLLPRTE